MLQLLFYFMPFKTQPSSPQGREHTANDQCYTGCNSFIFNYLNGAYLGRITKKTFGYGKVNYGIFSIREGECNRRFGIYAPRTTVVYIFKVIAPAALYFFQCDNYLNLCTSAPPSLLKVVNTLVFASTCGNVASNKPPRALSLRIKPSFAPHILIAKQLQDCHSIIASYFVILPRCIQADPQSPAGRRK